MIQRIGGIFLATCVAVLVLVGLGTAAGQQIGGGLLGAARGALGGLADGVQRLGPFTGQQALAWGAIAFVAIALFTRRIPVAAVVGLLTAALMYVPTLPAQISRGDVTGVVGTVPAGVSSSTTECDALLTAEHDAHQASLANPASVSRRNAYLAAQNRRLKAKC